MVALISGIHPDLTPEDREVKSKLGKCRPLAYSDLIRSDIHGSSSVSPSCSPCSTSLPPPVMETSPGGPLVVKPTGGELRVLVELLAKKRRSVKRKAQDPPESSLPASGKVQKLGVFDPRSRAQVQVRGKALSFSAEVSEVEGAQHRSSSTARVKGSSRKVVKPPLKFLPIFVWSPSLQNTLPFPPTRGDVGDDRFEAKGGEDSLLTNVELAVMAVSSILRDSNLKKVEVLCVEEALALSLQGTVSVCLSAFFYSSCCCVNVIY